MKTAILFLGILLASGPSAHAAPEDPVAQAVQPVDAKMDSLENFLDGYPPRFENPVQKQKVEADLKSALQTLNDLAAKYPNNLKIESRLGELYRLAHNLDQSGAWENSEKHLKKAIEIAPQQVYAHLMLGKLYVNTDPKYAPQAEAEFRKVLELGGGDSFLQSEGHKGLFFASYYQGRMKQAVDAADAYLKIHPDDVDIKKLRNIAFEKSQKKN